jgi:hypothetical protein
LIRAVVSDEYTRFDWKTNSSTNFRRFWEGDPMAVIQDVEILGVEFPLGREYAKASFDFGGRGHMFAR